MCCLPWRRENASSWPSLSYHCCLLFYMRKWGDARKQGYAYTASRLANARILIQPLLWVSIHNIARGEGYQEGNQILLSACGETLWQQHIRFGKSSTLNVECQCQAKSWWQIDYWPISKVSRSGSISSTTETLGFLCSIQHISKSAS